MGSFTCLADEFPPINVIFFASLAVISAVTIVAPHTVDHAVPATAALFHAVYYVWTLTHLTDTVPRIPFIPTMALPLAVIPCCLAARDPALPAALLPVIVHDTLARSIGRKTRLILCLMMTIHVFSVFLSPLAWAALLITMAVNGCHRPANTHTPGNPAPRPAIELHALHVNTARALFSADGVRMTTAAHQVTRALNSVFPHFSARVAFIRPGEPARLAVVEVDGHMSEKPFPPNDVAADGDADGLFIWGKCPGSRAAPPAPSEAVFVYAQHCRFRTAFTSPHPGVYEPRDPATRTWKKLSITCHSMPLAATRRGVEAAVTIRRGSPLGGAVELTVEAGRPVRWKVEHLAAVDRMAQTLAIQLDRGAVDGVLRGMVAEDTQRLVSGHQTVMMYLAQIGHTAARLHVRAEALAAQLAKAGTVSVEQLGGVHEGLAALDDVLGELDGWRRLGQLVACPLAAFTDSQPTTVINLLRAFSLDDSVTRQAARVFRRRVMADARHRVLLDTVRALSEATDGSVRVGTTVQFDVIARHVVTGPPYSYRPRADGRTVRVSNIIPSWLREPLFMTITVRPDPDGPQPRLVASHTGHSRPQGPQQTPDLLLSLLAYVTFLAEGGLVTGDGTEAGGAIEIVVPLAVVGDKSAKNGKHGGQHKPKK